MMKYSDCTLDCTGDICKGDIILFTEAVFDGSYRNAKYAGERRILAEVMDDSYGQDKQQHTFTLRLIRCTGVKASEVRLAANRTKFGTLRRKGRKIYRNGTLRAPRNEDERQAALDEKHRRGSAARQARAERKAEWA